MKRNDSTFEQFLPLFDTVLEQCCFKKICGKSADWADSASADKCGLGI